MEQARATTLVHHAMGRLVLSQVSKAFTKWLEESAEAMTQRSLAQQSLLTWMRRSGHTAYRTWQDAARKQSQDRGKVRQFVVWWTASALGRAYHTWQIRHRDAGFIRQVLSRMAHSRLSQGFHSWVSVTARHLDGLRKVRHTVMKVVLHRLARCPREDRVDAVAGNRARG